MSLFSRLFKPKAPTSEPLSYEALVAAVGLLLIAARERRDGSLRRSERMGELLGLLWLDDKKAHRAVWETFNSIEKLDLSFVEKLARLVYTQEHDVPASPEERYEAVVATLRDEIEHITSEISESAATAEDAKLLVSILTLSRILLPPELHAPICEFLIENNRSRRSDPLRVDSLPFQDLVNENIYRFLALLSVEEIPVFWERIQDEEVSQELWPTLRRIRDRRAVPYLLELLPAAPDEEGRSAMSLEGQKEVIQVLREIGDLRAVPVLLAMEKRLLPPPEEKPGIQTTWDRALSKTWRERNELARVAGQAARHIQRNSPEASAQLLRPSNAPTETGQTLLRPSVPGESITPPEELLRATHPPERTDKDA